MSWDKMCRTKEKGGLGFRDLGDFNLALLAKQGWRLINDKDSLCAKILKARYYANKDFLEVDLGYNPSFTWRSIIEDVSYY